MTQNTSNKTELQKLLKVKAKELSDEVIEADGLLSEERVRKLEGMERLIKVLEHTEPPPSRWPVIILLLATLVIVSILIFARVSTTEINLNVSLSEISFKLSRQQVITNVQQLSSLGVAGLHQIEFPDTGIGADNENFEEISSANAIRLAKDTGNGSESSLTMAPLLLNSKAAISISNIGDNGEAFGLWIRDSELSIKADVMGKIEYAIPGTPPRINNFTIPKSLVLHSDNDEVDISIHTLYDSKKYFSEQISIDSLSFFQIDEYIDDQHTVIRKVSGIKRGSIYFESLGGKERSLHPAEEIIFRQLDGYINNLQLANGDISFTFRGTVSGMTTGGQKDRISLMPTYLEWLMARHSLSLLWGTTLYILGLLLGIIHWWKTTK